MAVVSAYPLFALPLSYSILLLRLTEDGKQIALLSYHKHSRLLRYDSFVANYARQELRTLARIITGSTIKALVPLVSHDNVHDVLLSLIMNFELPLALNWLAILAGWASVPPDSVVV